MPVTSKRPGRPVSRILLYPAIHLRGLSPRAPCGAAPTCLETRRFWLARTGGLPGRSLSGYRRWALTPPFHPSPVPENTPLAGCTRPGHRLVCSLLHLTWRGACDPRPSGCWPERPLLRVRTLLYERGEPRAQRRVGRPEPRRIIPQALDAWPGAEPGLPVAADEDYPRRCQAKLHPLGAVPALLPAGVVLDAGVEPDSGAFRLEDALVGGVVLGL